jgi:hypothetical protein
METKRIKSEVIALAIGFSCFLYMIHLFGKGFGQAGSTL